MKLAIDESFQANGLGETNQFQMKASAMAFKILSDGLYKDKIGAIVRELACNAYDSHIMSGNADTPFTIHSPTYLDQTFRIRDYGTGLSESDTMTMYCTYFESTKTMTNSAIGCFGLGSKSPFSYTNSFTVNSYFEGVKYEFCVFLDASGFPNISKLSEEPSEEPSGLEVCISVDNNDRHKFESAIETYCKTFEFIECNIDIPKLNIVYEDKENSLSVFYKYNYSYGSSKSCNFYVKQGHIIYPVNFELLNIKQKDVKLLTASSNYSFLLDVPIGTLEVTPSREELGYDSRTIENLRTKIFEARDIYNKKLQSYLDEVIEEYPDDIFAYTKAFVMKLTELDPTGNLYFGDFEINHNNEVTTVSKMTDYHLNISKIKFSYDEKLKSKFRRRDSLSIICSDDDIFVSIPYGARIPQSSVSVFFNESENRNKQVRFVSYKMPSALEKYVISVDVFKAKYPAPARQAYSRTTTKSGILLLTTVSGSLKVKTLYKSYCNETIEKLKECYYINVNEVAKSYLYEMSLALSDINDLLNTQHKVYILNKSQVKIMEDNGMKHFKELLNTNVKAIITEANSAIFINDIGNRCDMTLMELISKYQPKYKKLTYSTVFAHLNYSYKVIHLLKLFNIKHSLEGCFERSAKMKDLFFVLQEEMNTDFGMFNLLEESYFSKEKKVILEDYIKLVLSKKTIKLRKSMEVKNVA